MGIYDILVLALLGLGTFLGLRKGLATQIAAIVSMGASFFVAVRFREPLSQHIDAAEPWNKFAAMLILYLGTSLVIWLFFRQIRTSIERMKLGEFDRQLGAVFGAVKGFAMACVVTLFAFTLLQEPQRQAIIHSKSGVWIARAIHKSTAIMPPEVLQYIDPYLRQLDEGFGTSGQNYYVQPQRPGSQGSQNWVWPPGTAGDTGTNRFGGREAYEANRRDPPYEFRPVRPGSR